MSHHHHTLCKTLLRPDCAEPQQKMLDFPLLTWGWLSILLGLVDLLSLSRLSLLTRPDPTCSAVVSCHRDPTRFWAALKHSHSLQCLMQSADIPSEIKRATSISQ